MPRMPCDDAGSKLADIAATYCLTQVVNDPTRSAGTEHAAQIDLVFVSKISLVSCCTVLTTLADHSPTILCLNMRGHHSEACQQTTV